MDWGFTAFLVAVGLAVAIALYLARSAWVRREIQGAASFALAMVAIAEAASMYFLASITIDPTLAFVFVRLRFLGLAAVPVLIFMFVIAYTNRTEWLPRKVIVLLWAIPLATQLVLWLGPNTLFFQHWAMVHSGMAYMEESQFTGWFWVHFLYSDTLLIVGGIWLGFYVWRVDRSLMSGALWIIAGIIVGLLGSLPWFTIGAPPGFKFTPIGLGLTGIGLAMALFRYRLFDHIPIAYDAIYRGMRNPVIVTDDQNRVIQANPAAKSLMQPQIPNLIGADIRDVFGFDKGVVTDQQHTVHGQKEFLIVLGTETFSYDVHVSPLYQRDRYIGQLIVLNDITERKRAESRFRALFDSAPDAMVIVNGQGNIALANSQTETLFGYKREELIGKSMEMLIPDRFRSSHPAHRDDYTADPDVRGMGVGLELYALRKDGSEFPVEISLSHVQTTEGVVTASAIRDITERTVVERRLQAVLESAPDAIVIVNQQNNIVLVNSQTTFIFGYGRDELIGKSIELLIPERFHGSHRGHVTGYVSDSHSRRVGVGKGLELYALRKDGSQFPVEISLSPIETADGILIVSAVRDITERKRAETALRESEANYKKLFVEVERQTQELALLDKVRTALARELDLPTVFRKVVEAVAETYGYTQVSLYKIEGDYSILQHQVGYETVLERVSISAGVSGRVIRERKAILVEDVRNDPDFLAAIAGLVSEICVPFFDQGKVAGFLNIESTGGIQLTDADLRLMVALSLHIEVAVDRARLYTEARKNEEWFRLLFDDAPTGMMVVGLDGKIERVNQAFGALLGYTPEEMTSHKFPDLTYPADLSENLKLIERLVKGEIHHYQLEKRYVARSGKLVTVILRSALLRDAQRQPHHLIEQALDISERKAVEQQALELAAERQRVSILNGFIRDASHHFRTPLAIINASAHGLSRNDDPERRREVIERIAVQVRHLTEMLEQILTMSHLDSIESLPIKPVRLNDLIREAMYRVAELVKQNHLTIIEHLDETAVPIMANPEQLAVAIGNIAENAVLYTLEGGTITIQSHRFESSVVVEVTDTGIGIPDESLPHIFERLYRADKTRPVQTAGVGLGLSIAKRILDLHHGNIEVESQVGQGSIFRITIPT